MKTKKMLFVALVLCFSFLSGAETTREQCTAAVVSPPASSDGIPILWKNRDTDVLSNKAVYVEAVPFSYIALVNARVPSGRHSFAGLNSAGFAIMNTVAYNLPRKSGETENLEGIIMADALRTCRTADDFEAYLKANLGPDLGSWANFGVIDGSGQAFLFEVHNNGYEKFDAASVPEKYLVVTNFSRSGSAGKGAGYLRFERATELFQGLSGKIGYRDILTRFTRDIGHVLLDHPSLSDLKKIAPGKEPWLFTRDCIDRPSTAAAVVIVGKNPSAPGSPATMWVIPGEPLCAVAVPLWAEAKQTPGVLWEGEEAPMWKESLRIKSIIRPFKEGNKGDYISLAKLDNSEGTGFLPGLLAVEEDILRLTESFLKENHTPLELAQFEEQMTMKAYEALKAVK